MADTGTAVLRLSRFEVRAKAWVAGAQALADERRHAEVTPMHLLARALGEGGTEPGVVRALTASGVDVGALRRRIDAVLAGLPQGTEPSYLAEATLRILERAQRLASRRGTERTERRDLFLALVESGEGELGDVWAAARVDATVVRPRLDELDAKAPAGVVDWVEEARRGALDPVIGRVDLIRRVLSILERRTKHHVLLVGEEGVGRRALLRAIAERIARGDVSERLLTSRMWLLDAASLVAGVRLRSEVDSKLGGVVREAQRGGGSRTIVVLPEIEVLLGSGPQGAVLGELLGEGSMVRVVATASPAGLTKLQSDAPALAQRLTAVTVDEPASDEALEMVRGGAHVLELHHDVHFSESALRAATDLAGRYLRERCLPGSAFDLLDEAAARFRLGAQGMPEALDRQASELLAVETQLASLGGAHDEMTERARAELRDRAARLRPSVEAARTSVDEHRRRAELLRQLRAERAELVARSEEAASRDGQSASALEDVERRLTEAEAGARDAAFVDAEGPVTDEHVASVVASSTGIPVTRMMEGEGKRLRHLEEKIGARVLGQDHAVGAVSRAVRRARVGLRDGRKPIGSFLFLGPSGVGKTELAKALAEALFDDEAALTRLDMSEFMEKHMAQRLIGAPPGYADSEQGGFLTEAVRKRPYSVLLFDEVEKAHQDVFNLLLQLLDEGRLTDGRGRLADFSNTVVLLTSNIGSERILDADAEAFETEEGQELLRESISDALHRFFRPELLNRLDDTLIFRPLDKKLLRRILQHELGKLRRHLEPRRLSLDVGDAELDELVERGYEPKLGARPLQRAVVAAIFDPIAEAVVEGRAKPGSVLTVRLEGDAFRIDVGDGEGAG